MYPLIDSLQISHYCFPLSPKTVEKCRSSLRLKQQEEQSKKTASTKWSEPPQSPTTPKSSTASLRRSSSPPSTAKPSSPLIARARIYGSSSTPLPSPPSNLVSETLTWSLPTCQNRSFCWPMLFDLWVQGWLVLFISRELLLQSIRGENFVCFDCLEKEMLGF